MAANWRVNLNAIVGQGSFSTVYQAANLQDPRRSYVAKVANKEAKKSREALERECDVLSSLSHPHIAQLLDEGVVQGRVMYIMPAYGISLYQLIYMEKFQAISQVNKLAAELFDALAYIHEKEWIHSDVSLTNIYLHGEKVMLADFGSCQGIHEKKRIWITTVDSRPPEIFMLAQEYGTEVDVWSAAQVVISVLLKRVGPFSFPREEKDFSQTQTERALRQFISYIGSTPPTSMKNYQKYFNREGALKQETPLELALITRESVQREIDHKWRLQETSEINRIMQRCLIWIDRPTAAQVGEKLKRI